MAGNDVHKHDIDVNYNVIVCVASWPSKFNHEMLSTPRPSILRPSWYQPGSIQRATHVEMATHGEPAGALARLALPPDKGELRSLIFNLHTPATITTRVN